MTTKLKVGDKVKHTQSGYKGVLVLEKEGWWQIQFDIDKSFAIVPPSSLELERPGTVDNIPLKALEKMRLLSSLVAIEKKDPKLAKSYIDGRQDDLCSATAFARYLRDEPAVSAAAREPVTVQFVKDAMIAAGMPGAEVHKAFQLFSILKERLGKAAE